MTDTRTIPNFYPCYEPTTVANLAAYEPLAFDHDGERIYDIFGAFSFDDLPTKLLECGFTCVGNGFSLMVRPHEEGGSIRIKDNNQGGLREPLVVSRVDSEGHVLATFLATDIPMAGVTIQEMSRDHISADILKPLYFEFEGDSIIDPYTSECGRFDTDPSRYGFVLDDANPLQPVMTRPHEDGGKLVLSFVAPVDGGEGGPLLTRYDADGNVLGAAMIAHIYGADIGAL